MNFDFIKTDSPRDPVNRVNCRYILINSVSECVTKM